MKNFKMLLKCLVLVLCFVISLVHSTNQLTQCIRETGDRQECILQRVFTDQLFALNNSKSSNFISNFPLKIFWFILNETKKGLKHLRNAQHFIVQEGLEVCIDFYRQELCEIAQLFIWNSSYSSSDLQNQSKVHFFKLSHLFY